MIAVKATLSTRRLQNLVTGFIGELGLLHALELQVFLLVLLLDPGLFPLEEFLFLFVELGWRARVSAAFEVAASASSCGGRVSPDLGGKRAFLHLVILTFLLIDDLLVLFSGFPLLLIAHQPISGLLISLSELPLMLLINFIFNLSNSIFVKVEGSLVLHNGPMERSFRVFFPDNFLEEFFV